MKAVAKCHRFAPMQRRCIFSGLNLNPFNAGPPPKSFREQRVLSLTASEMYNVVADVDAYKDFVPWCQESRVMQRWSTGPNVKRYNAELSVGFGAISERYTSNVTAATPLDARGFYCVEAVASDTTLFKQLVTTWSIRPHGEIDPRRRECVVDFDIQFQFRSVLHAQLTDLFFSQVCQAMVRAFEQRAHQLYRAR